jgi:AAA15 family ATPase/GTPase
MKILSNNVKIHLADKGMGSIQAMLLIMRIACVIKKIKLAEKNSTVTRMVDGKEVKQDSSNYRLIDKTTVIIEEPELNLHPALQSKLADLFLDVHQRFNIDFLIETHSEYILRRSQVLVAENEFEVAPNENPFCVHYFPKDPSQQPYRLEYEANGRFNRNFGDGFFDEATNSTMALIKLQRSK